MKKIAYLLFPLILLGIASAGAQPLTFAQRVAQASSQDQSKLTPFDLDFPGGTPAELVAAIEKATGKPLNAIIPTDDADTQLPPLKMNNVVVHRLFDALKAASERTVAVQTSFAMGNYGSSYSQSQVGYGFNTSDSPVTDNSIWNFYVLRPSLPPVVSTAPVTYFFQLEDYLNSGLTVDDITTAIQTGWKMAGITSPPQLNYHKETKLLIAFGKPDDLKTIENVLSALPRNKSNHNSGGDQIDQTIKLMRLETQIKQLSEQVAFLITNSSEKIKPAR